VVLPSKRGRLCGCAHHHHHDFVRRLRSGEHANAGDARQKSAQDIGMLSGTADITVMAARGATGGERERWDGNHDPTQGTVIGDEQG
jgi:hypothetical protein